MKNTGSVKEIVAAGVILAALWSAPAHAYLDPATGAAVGSAILGFFAAIYFTVRRYYYKIVRVFRRKGGSE